MARRDVGVCCGGCRHWDRDLLDDDLRESLCDLRGLRTRGADWCVSHHGAACAVVRWAEAGAAEMGIGEDWSGKCAESGG